MGNESLERGQIREVDEHILGQELLFLLVGRVVCVNNGLLCDPDLFRNLLQDVWIVLELGMVLADQVDGGTSHGLRSFALAESVL